LLSTILCLLTWRTNFFACGGKYPSTLVPGLPTTAPPFGSSPTLSHPTVQVTLFTYATIATPRILDWNSHATKPLSSDLGTDFVFNIFWVHLANLVDSKFQEMVFLTRHPLPPIISAYRATHTCVLCMNVIYNMFCINMI
jgi:hypothetical protein